MRIDTTAIEGYENMTAEEKLAALEGYEYEDNSSELEKLKKSLTKANAEAADWKKKHNALLSEDEQKKSEQDEKFTQMEEELKKLREEKVKSTYKTKLLADGYDEALAEASAKALAEGDTETFFANQKKFLTDHDKAYKQKLMNTDLKPGGSSDTKFKSKDDIMKIKDTTERREAIANNPELFGIET